MINYEVGQILYLTNEKSFKIIPVQVVEEVTRTTIDGKDKTYLVQFPDSKKTTVDIRELKYNCFKTEREVRDYLINNTKVAIDKLLEVANELKKESFSYHKEILTFESDDTGSPEENFKQPKKDDDIIKVDLGNGQTGKLKVSDLNKGVK